MITKELFCHLKDGRAVYSYTIQNIHGESVKLLDYGASIQEINVRDRYGNIADVVMGADPDHLEAFTFEGGTIGRCANRIAYGRCEIGGKQYQLEQNMLGHFLHGGSGNYAQKLFTGKIIEQENKVIFFWHDTGEGGFDCCVDAAFSFSFDDEGRLALALEMEGEDTTILNPTNHSYFNLTVDGDARDHWLYIASKQRAARGESGIPNGGSIPVSGSPADFTWERQIREAMSKDPTGYFTKEKPSYDEFYLFQGREYRLTASLRCQENGRRMNVYTDMPCLVLFVCSGRKPELGKNGRIYDGYSSVCLETGFVPNAVNCPQYDSPVFQKGEKLIARTVYQFLAD